LHILLEAAACLISNLTERVFGQKNLAVVRARLDELSIPIQSENSGGNYGRTMKFYASTGKVEISTVSKGEKKSVTVPTNPAL